MLEHTEHLAGQVVFWDAIAVIEPCLGSPANIQGGLNVRLDPVEYLRELIPIIHLLEGHLLDGRAGDDQTVEFLAAHIVEGQVVMQQVVGIGIFGIMCGSVKQRDFHLERRVG